MFLAADYKPEFDSLKEWLPELSQFLRGEDLAQHLVNRLAARPHVALARVWLLGPGQGCNRCELQPRCLGRDRCLHLVADAGTRRVEERPHWARIDSDYERIPLGVGRVGQVAASGQAVVVRDYAGDPGSLVRYSWAQEQQQIRGLNIQPVCVKEQMLGVLAVFTAIPTPPEGPAWLRILADQLAQTVARQQAQEELRQWRACPAPEGPGAERSEAGEGLGELVGLHPLMRELYEQIALVAPTDATVLIQGESGTGKELVARELHRRSHRAQRPLIRVNCASVPRELYESEFFGHIKGAFTGAIKDRAGRFEAADGGTLLLDEVGEIPLALQSKFLRVLQERQYERVGEERTRSVNVRILAATNRDLKKEIAAGRFREDLFYRLNVFPLQVPPLRLHKADIPQLAACLLEQAARRLRLPATALAPEQTQVLQAYAWPGNVRELQNVLERALILARGGRLQLPDLSGSTPVSAGAAPEGHSPLSPVLGVLTEEQLREVERNNLLRALERSGWVIHGPQGAARLLGIKPTTLASRLKKFGLRRP